MSKLDSDSVRILGLETSCDETSVGVVEDGTLRAMVLHSQGEHRVHGGVVPEIAAREHLRHLPGIVDLVLERAGWTLDVVEAIAVTRGPGLAGCLLVGLHFAAGLSRALQIPAMGINHLEGHLAAVRLSHPELQPPFVALTVSGGHTELTRMNRWSQARRLGSTRDDAAGEAFDKAGKLLGLGYPAGPRVAQAARLGDPAAFNLPRGLLRSSDFDFSFSGLKTAVRREVELLGGPQAALVRRNDLCASLQEAVVDVLVQKSVRALHAERLDTLVVGGGVSANVRLRETMGLHALREGFQCLFPEPALSVDNGAMIAAACALRLEEDALDDLPLRADPRLALGA